jgi:hypothetical protein
MRSMNWLGMLLALGACSDSATVDAGATQAAIIERGRYLTVLAGCGDCHTPWPVNPATMQREPDEKMALSGHPASLVMPAPPTLSVTAPWTVTLRANVRTMFYGSPYGTAYAQNLTPDPDTGWLEGWTEQTFIQVIKTGKEKGTGRTLANPMLYVCWRMAQATDEDLKAIFAYLRSLKAIPNHVPDYVGLPDAGP